MLASDLHKNFSFLPSLIDSAYSNDLKNVENVLKFVGDLPDEHSAIGCQILYEAMKLNNHLESYQLIMLAHKIEQLTKNSNLTQTSKLKLDALKSDLPKYVRDFLWSSGKSCTIKNEFYSEHFYVPHSFYKFNDKRRQVLTWIRKGDADVDGYWNFRTNDNGKSFAIKNEKENEFLYADKNFAFDNDRRRVFTWGDKGEKNGSQFYWKIAPKDGKFVLTNVAYEEFLYASSKTYDTNRRNVFTWRKSGAVPSEEAKWEIKCDVPVKKKCYYIILSWCYQLY